MLFRASSARLMVPRLTRAMSTNFDGDMARLYMKFFNQAEPAWELTDEIVKDAQQLTGGTPFSSILDVASGPGEPAVTLAKSYPGCSKIICTDGAETMNALGQARIKEHGVDSQVSTLLMDLNNFSPVARDKPFDLVTAQFALMFTPDLPGSLSEIHSVLREEGLLVGTVWEEFHILPLLKETMTQVLQQEPPPPPINPLGLKDADMVDAALKDAGFATLGRHNERAHFEINIGKFDHEDTIKTALIPVTPALASLQKAGNHGSDVLGTAMDAMRKSIKNHDMIDGNGDVVITESTYRYFCAKKI
jgi:SAM-dependent methyltransferase